MVTTALVKTMTKKVTWGSEGSYQPNYSPSGREVRAGVHGRNLEAGIEAETTKECCFLACSGNFLIQLWPTCLWILPFALGWALLHQFSIKRMPPRHALRPICWRQFFS